MHVPLNRTSLHFDSSGCIQEYKRSVRSILLQTQWHNICPHSPDRALLWSNCKLHLYNKAPGSRSRHHIHIFHPRWVSRSRVRSGDGRGNISFDDYGMLTSRGEPKIQYFALAAIVWHRTHSSCIRIDPWWTAAIVSCSANRVPAPVYNPLWRRGRENVCGVAKRVVSGCAPYRVQCGRHSWSARRRKCVETRVCTAMHRRTRRVCLRNRQVKTDKFTYVVCLCSGVWVRSIVCSA